MSDPQIGKTCVARVSWPNGRTTETEGEIIAIHEDANEVYMESPYGPVAADLDTLQIVDEEPEPELDEECTGPVCSKCGDHVTTLKALNRK